MSALHSSLSDAQQHELLSLFHCARLHLLYKASVHGYTAAAFHRYCDQQGPTLTAAYNHSGFLFGTYTALDYGQTGRDLKDDRAFLYSVKAGRETIHVPSGGQYGFTDGTGGPNFESLEFLYEDMPTIHFKLGHAYHVDASKMYGFDRNLTEFEVYRVEDLGCPGGKPWRNMQWTEERRQQLIQSIQTYKPDCSSVQQARILLLGPVGAGKSSFFNSINSVFRGHMTCQAIPGSQATSLTTEFRTYSIRSSQSGTRLNVLLSDTMGLDGCTDTGLHSDDVFSMYRGHVRDHYQFNPSMPLQASAPGFRSCVGLQEQVHCVVYVVDACMASEWPPDLLEKLTAIRKKTNQMGIPQLLLMTKVDQACPLVAEDITKVYSSRYIRKKVEELSGSLGAPLSSVLLVQNYSEELQLNLSQDLLLLTALQHMLHYADSFLDNQQGPHNDEN